MKLIHGETLVRRHSQRPDPTEQEVHRGPEALLTSRDEPAMARFSDGSKLYLWGRIDGAVDGSCLLSAVRPSPPATLPWPRQDPPAPEDVQARFEGRYVAVLVGPDGAATVFGDSKNRRDLFYTFEDDGLIASTDLSGLPAERFAEFDQAALASLLTLYGWSAPKKHTVYRRVRRLGVGERILIGSGRWRIEQTPFEPLEVGEYGEDQLQEYAALLEQAVCARASPGCNWVYLSGGWDSTAILAILVQSLGSRRVRAVTAEIEPSARIRGWNKPDLERARRFADLYGVPIDVVPVENDGVAERWEELAPYLAEQHIFSDNACNYHLLARHARLHGRAGDVIFCGEISDGAHSLGFATSNTILDHPSHDFREYSDKMAQYLFGPTFYRSILDGSCGGDAVYRLLRSRFEGERFRADLERMDARSRTVELLSSFFLRGRRIPFYELSNERILTRRGAEVFQEEMQRVYLEECLESITAANIYSWLLQLYNSFHWQGSTIKAVTATAELNGLEAALPFWDSRLLRFLERMPESWGRGLDFRRVKYPLKEVLARRYNYPVRLQRGPKSFLSDIDPSLSAHAERLYRSAMAPHLRRAVQSFPFEEVLDRRYFDHDYLAQLSRDYCQGTQRRGRELADLYRLAWFCYLGPRPSWRGAR